MAKVSIVYDGKDEGTHLWMLNIECDGEVRFGFLVHEPTIQSYENWCDFLDGKILALNFYQGNGEGSIKKAYECMQFIANPSGGGGDVTSDISVSFDIYAPLIREKINEAKKLGYFD